MSIQEQIIRQRDFSSGVVDPDAVRRDDVDALKFALRDARNMANTHTGGLIRRPGRRFLFEDFGIIMDFKPFDDVAYRVVFIDGGVKVRTEDGALVASLVAPWGADDLDDLVFEPMDNEIFVAWPGQTQVIKIAEGTYAWSIAAFSFAVGLNNAIRMPFFRFESSQNVTMYPSATTGTISITFSAPILSPLHVGVRFRYAGRQIHILNVLSATVATALVIESLPTAQRVTVANGSAFSIGQVVETDTTNAKAEVVSVSGNDVTVVPVELLTIPIVGETLVSPTGSAKISAVAAVGTASIVQWDEQFISAYRGWPRSVSKDRQRLIMTNFQQKKNAVFWSAAGNNRDGQIGGDPDNAILEYISAECQVYHVVGGYDEFAVTDRGVFYVPVSVGTPLQPGSVEFRPIFSGEIANIRPLEVTEGLIFIDKSGTGIYAVSATGQTARPYIANEVNRLHRTLFHGVKSIAVSSGTPVFPSRQVYAVNDDGTLVVGQFNPDRDYIGWLPWDGAGEIRSITGNYGSVVCMSVYTFDGVEVGVAEALDYSLLCDCAQTFSADDFADFLELNDGSPLQVDDGTVITLNGIVTGFFAGKDVELFAGGFYFGAITVPEDGIINGYSDYAALTIGVGFDWEFHPLFTNFEGGQPVGQGEQKRKIAKMLMAVRETQEFQAGNRVFGSYRGGEDLSLPIPNRNDTYKYRETGRSYDPDVPIKSTFPCAFKLIELTTRITV
ncbi:hypothetical protein GYN07_20995 [Rhizobium leguminosarum bv. viciae 248]|uniref:hypothetical protein n=1 Tax=Rhizobium leguminosarum TaxID=384 RepID=UPI0003615340|nr:hypothetical protein [Rhizobium leguminosarum]QHW26659.1 hypothetical protein GYN07_20995 [Rhizobium leguminosarum bv. viciae 248]